MPPVSLKKLLKKDSLRILDAVCEASSGPIGIFDTDHQLLYGPEDTARYLAEAAPIVVNGRPEGWVAGKNSPREQFGIANLLAYILAQEAEKKDLATEVLERYRELNLVYRLSSRLMTSPQPELIAHMALDEICPLIHAMHGAVLLRTGTDGEAVVLASCGSAYHANSAGMDPGIIVKRVIQTGVAEMVNRQPTGGHFPGGEKATRFPSWPRR